MEASIATKQDSLRISILVSIEAMVSEVLIRALQQENQALLLGNGGIAADAYHIPAQSVGRFAFDRHNGGKRTGCVDHCICAHSNETPRIQEWHILTGHIISELVERENFHDRDGVINQKPPEGECITRWEEMQILPAVLDAIALFRGLATTSSWLPIKEAWRKDC